MSLNLTLLPLTGPSDLLKTRVNCIDRLRFDDDYEIFFQLTNSRGTGNTRIIKGNPIPVHLYLRIYDEEGMHETRTDPLGDELTFIYADALKRLVLPNDTSPKNRAIMAFIDALPNDTPIFLLWG